MSAYHVKRITNEIYLVGDKKYYLEYLGLDKNSRLQYCLIEKPNTSHRPPIHILTDSHLNILNISGDRLTPEEASVCHTKGMIIKSFWIRKPKVKLISRILNATIKRKKVQMKMNSVRLMFHIVKTFLLFWATSVKAMKIWNSPVQPDSVGFVNFLKISFYHCLFCILSDRRTHGRLGRKTYWAVRYSLKRMCYHMFKEHDPKKSYEIYYLMLKTTSWRYSLPMT